MPDTQQLKEAAESGSDAPTCSRSSIANPAPYTDLWYADRIIELERERAAMLEQILKLASALQDILGFDWEPRTVTERTRTGDARIGAVANFALSRLEKWRADSSANVRAQPTLPAGAAV